VIKLIPESQWKILLEWAEGRGWKVPNPRWSGIRVDQDRVIGDIHFPAGLYKPKDV
jgi:hypothetical protein